MSEYTELTEGWYVPFGHMVVQPLRTHDPQGSFLSHFSFNL